MPLHIYLFLLSVNIKDLLAYGGPKRGTVLILLQTNILIVHIPDPEISSKSRYPTLCSLCCTACSNRYRLKTKKWISNSCMLQFIFCEIPFSSKNQYSVLKELVQPTDVIYRLRDKESVWILMVGHGNRITSPNYLFGQFYFIFVSALSW